MMKIVDAYWEKRNLGVDCKEVLVEDGDSVELLLENLAEIETAGYIVFKIPVARFDIASTLAKQGYFFIESLINITLDPKKAVIAPSLAKLNQTVTYREMKVEELSTLYERIDEEMFQTDRITLDPYFSRKIAALRYINWVQDEVAKGAQIYETCYKDQGVAFFAMKEVKNNIYNPFLGGVYLNQQDMGWGYFNSWKVIEEVGKRGGKISTYISTNNAAVHKMYLQQGYVANETRYVFIKHSAVNQKV